MTDQRLEWAIVGCDKGGEWISAERWTERPDAIPACYAGGYRVCRTVTDWAKPLEH